MNITESVLLQHFILGLSLGAEVFLDSAAGGSFSHLTVSEGKKILDKILEKASDLGEVESPLTYPQDPPKPNTDTIR